MDENVELLEYIYKNAEMGVFTITELLKDLNGKENKIKVVAEKELKEFEKFYKDSEKLLSKHNVPKNKNGTMAKMGASMGIKKETKKEENQELIELINDPVRVAERYHELKEIEKEERLNQDQEQDHRQSRGRGI